MNSNLQIYEKKMIYRQTNMHLSVIVSDIWLVINFIYDILTTFFRLQNIAQNILSSVDGRR